jgi:hypothetical protein
MNTVPTPAQQRALRAAIDDDRDINSGDCSAATARALVRWSWAKIVSWNSEEDGRETFQLHVTPVGRYAAGAAPLTIGSWVRDSNGRRCMLMEWDEEAQNWIVAKQYGRWTTYGRMDVLVPAYPSQEG